MILQLNPSIPVETLSGKGQAVALIDYSPEHDFYWVVFLDHNRECWTFQNKDIRAQENFSLGRSAKSHINSRRPPLIPKDFSGAV